MSQKTIIILCLAVLCFGSVRTQTISEKNEVVNSIAKKISYAYGTDLNMPQIEVVPGKRNLIMFYPGANSKIVMDEYLYDMCTDFGSDSLNALAALIGHELAHHFENHDWCYSFAREFSLQAQKALSIKRISKEQKLNNESEADYFGSFYANVAGFNTQPIFPEMVDRIYKDYDLSLNNREYPYQSELREIIVNQQSDLLNLGSALKAGKYLYALEEFEKASNCFAYLTSSLPSSRILTQLGICKLQDALSYQTLKEFPFALPLEIEPYSRLSVIASSADTISGEENNLKYRVLLDEARNHLDSSLVRKPENFDAELNRSLTYLLSNHVYDAKQLLDDIKSDKGEKITDLELSKIYTLIAIAEYKNEDIEKSTRYFEKSKELDDNITTQFNLNVIRKINTNDLSGISDYVIKYIEENDYRKKALMLNPEAEKIAGKNPGDFQKADSNFSLILNDESKDEIIAEYQPYYAFINYQMDEQGIVFLETANNTKSKSREGISINSSVRDLKDKYGEPTYQIDVLGDTYLVYRKIRIIVSVDDKNKVTNWTLFQYR